MNMIFTDEYHTCEGNDNRHIWPHNTSALRFPDTPDQSTSFKGDVTVLIEMVVIGENDIMNIDDSIHLVRMFRT